MTASEISLDREPLRAWMKEVMLHTGWSAREWARRAHTSPSNITRFLANDRASVPTVRTVARLDAASPLQAPHIRSLGHPAPKEARSEVVEPYENVPPSERQKFLEDIRRMTNAAEHLMSLDEFLAWEREQTVRYEYAGGVATMMTGGSIAHATITMNITLALRQALRETGCRPFASDAKVIANGAVRYPDVSVTCQPVDDRDDTVPNPVLVVEVISPSTEREDRGRKKFDYFATPSIRHYAIVEQEARRIDLYTRTGEHWTDEVVEESAILKLTALGVEIGLDAVYEDTTLASARPPRSETALN